METSDASQHLPIVRRVSSRPVPAIVRPRLARASSGSSLSPRLILRAATRWWWQIVVLWVVGTASLCVGVHYGLKPKYEAGSLLRVEPISQDLFSKGDFNVSWFQNYLETQVELVTSSNVLLAAAADPRLANLPTIRNAIDPESVLRKLVQVRIIPRSYLIRISSWSLSPTEAADVTNTVVDAYLKADAEWSDGMSRHLIKNLEAYAKDLEGVVAEKQKAWLALAAKGNLDIRGVPKDRGDPASSSITSVTIEEYQRVREQLFQTELALGEAEATLGMATEAEAGHDRSITQSLSNDPELVELSQQIAALEANRARIGRVARESSDPALASLVTKIRRLKTQYNQLAAARRNDPASRVAHSSSGTDTRTVKEAELRVTSLRATKARLVASLGQLEITNREQNTDAVKITLIQADLKHLEEMQAAVNRRLEQYRFESRGQARIRLISEAMPAGGPASDKRPKILLVTPIVALGIVLGFFTMLEVRAGRICNPVELSQALNLGVFLVPQIPVAQGETEETYAEKVDEFVHRIDHIREAICGGMHETRQGRCVFVTSAVSGEGKTLVSRHIAMRCASAGISTLLVDADLRQAMLGTILDVPDSPGLSDVLEGRVPVEVAVVKVDPAGLCSFLPAGTPETNPGRIFQDFRFARTLERLRQIYDVIIIDTPPVIPVPDGLAIGRLTDGAILVTRHDQSRLPLVEEASRLLDVARIPVLAAVVNDIRISGGNTYRYQARRMVAPRTSLLR